MKRSKLALLPLGLALLLAACASDPLPIPQHSFGVYATVVAHQVAQQATADQNLLHGCSTPLTGTQSSLPLTDGHAR
ncbi:hypothetical protein K3Z88_20855 [Pseudomonas aeruginosa]|nr:hypothetical protein [Pseudomonas aeruginosa]